MKKMYTLVAALLLSTITFAQAPEKMSYQAVVRDGSNVLVTGSPVGMQISILQGSSVGSVVYTETQTQNTNVNGLVSIEIGTVTVSLGDFSLIDWSAGPYFIKTETDPTGGSSYTVIGTSQLMSVPYALYAKNSGSSTPGPQGLQGPAGSNGIDGNDGAQGPQGQAGAAGTNGNDGAQGPQGQAGVAGTNGNDGAQGPQGIQGPAGPDDQTIDGFSLSGTTLSLSLENDGQIDQTVDLSSLSGGGSSVFGTTSNVTSNENGSYNSDDLVFGSAQLDDDGNSSHDARLFFDKSNGISI